MNILSLTSRTSKWPILPLCILQAFGTKHRIRLLTECGVLSHRVAFCRIGMANRIVGLFAFGCASLLRLLGKLKQSANSAGNRILGDLRFGDLAELPRGSCPRDRCAAGRPDGGCPECYRRVSSKACCTFFAGFGGGLGGTAHIGVIEVGQTVGLAAGLAIGTLPVHSRAERVAPMSLSMRSMASGSLSVTRSGATQRAMLGLDA